MDLPSDLLAPVWVDWLGCTERLVLQDRLKVYSTIAELLTTSSFVASGEPGIATEAKVRYEQSRQTEAYLRGPTYRVKWLTHLPQGMERY